MKPPIQFAVGVISGFVACCTGCVRGAQGRRCVRDRKMGSHSGRGQSRTRSSRSMPRMPFCGRTLSPTVRSRSGLPCAIIL